MKKLVIALGLTMSLSPFVYANNALQDYRQGNYEKAKNGLKQLAAKNDKDALYYYGLMTLNGYAVKKNEVRAIDLIKQSASRGHLQAQLFLATYYLDVNKNEDNAFFWFQKAADQGSLAAGLYVASAYHHGFGVKPNSDLETKYIIKAAQQGSAIAQYYLAKTFLKKRNYKSQQLGIAWLKKSAKQEFAPAYYELIQGYENLYDKRQFWLDKLKNTNTAEAAYYLGKYYLSFSNREMKLSAIGYLNASAEKNYVPAIYELGILHQSSELNLLDDKKAFEEINSAATQGYSPAQVQLALMYQKGIGTEIDHKQEKYWLDKSKNTSYDAKKALLFSWLNNNQPLANLPTAYQHNSILTKWHDKTNTMNQSPKMMKLTEAQVFNTKLTFTNPQDIDAYLLADTIRLGSNKVFSKLPSYPVKNNAPSQLEVKDTYSRALLGNREAQFLLGQYHEYGIGVDKNLNAAAQWYFASAKQNYLPAEYSLGLAFLKGAGINQNLEKASYWLNRTAFKGNVDAQYALGILYQHGFQADDNIGSIAKDPGQSEAMYHLASGGGDPKAKYQLALEESQKRLDRFASKFAKDNQHQKVTHLFEEAYQGGVSEAKLPLAFYYVKEGIAQEKQQWAYKVLSEEVKNGNMNATLLLALMNDRGIGTPINYNEAIKWYKVAATNNLSAAQFVLGSYYYLGKFVNKNTLKSQRLLEQAALNKFYYADYNLGVIAKEQSNSPLPYIQKAADAGYIKAKLFLADKLLEKKDNLSYVASIYQALADKGNEQALLKLGFMYQNGIYFSANPQKATEYYLKAAQKNNAMAQYQLGFFNQLGLSGKAKANSAIHWYAKAAKNNYVPAMVGLGFIYENDKNNYKKAEFWYAKASEQQNPVANYNLALIHDYGKGVQVDNAKAVRLYENAANKGISSAKLNLANYYYNNKGSNESLQNSIHWFEEAAKDNSAKANFMLGRIYEAGLGANIDVNKAKTYYERALALGNIDAAMSLARLYQTNELASNNQKVAYELTLKAANENVKFAKFQLANMLYLGLGVDKSETKALKLWQELANKKYKPALVVINNIDSITQAKQAHAKAISELKNQAKKEGEELTALPKLDINIKQSIGELSKNIKNTQQVDSAQEMYLAALDYLEQGKLYDSYAILAEIVTNYPNYEPAKKSLSFLSQQEKSLLL